MSQTILEIDSLSVNFGGLKALSNVSVNLREGEVLGLIGPNGAGKTTLFNALSGFVPAATGSLKLFGSDRNWPRPDQLVHLGVARTLQGVGLFPELTVLENVMLGADSLAKTGLVRAAIGLTRRDEERLAQRAQTMLGRVYAGHLADRRADTLSYPDTKRVAIARALVSEPKILLLDEPAGGLGAQDIAWLNGLIRNLTSSCSIILVEHHMDVVMSVCNRIYVLNFGEVIANGTPEEVRNDEDVIAAYLGASAAHGGGK
jgi:branched-chain amino acid transport system ATP-binding protein